MVNPIFEPWFARKSRELMRVVDVSSKDYNLELSRELGGKLIGYLRRKYEPFSEDIRNKLKEAVPEPFVLVTPEMLLDVIKRDESLGAAINYCWISPKVVIPKRELFVSGLEKIKPDLESFMRSCHLRSLAAGAYFMNQYICERSIKR